MRIIRLLATLLALAFLAAPASEGIFHQLYQQLA